MYYDAWIRSKFCKNTDNALTSHTCYAMLSLKKNKFDILVESLVEQIRCNVGKTKSQKHVSTIWVEVFSYVVLVMLL